MNYERRFIEAGQPAEFQGEPDPNVGSSSGLDLGAIWAILRRQRNNIAAIGALGVCLMGLYLLFAPRVYTATASVILDARQPKLFNIDGVLANGGADQDGIDTQIELLRSPRIALRALDLMKSRGIALPAIAGGGKVETAKIPLASEAPAPASDEHLKDASAPAIPSSAADYDALVLDRFRGNLKVERKGRSLLVDVMYTDTDAARAAAIADVFADAYIADQLGTKWQTTQENSRALKDRVDQLREELEQAETKIQQYRVDKDIVEVGDVTLAQKEVADYAQELAKARAREAEAEAKLSQVHSMNNEVERDSARNEVKILETGLDNLKQKMQKGSEQLIKFNEMRRDADAYKTLYSTLLNQYKERQAQEKSVSPDAQIVNYAVVPSEASFPKKKLMLGAALLGSLLFGTGLVLLRDLTGRIFHSAADVERYLGTQTTATIPLIAETDGDRPQAGSASPGSSPIDLLRLGKTEAAFDQAVFGIRKWVDLTAAVANPIVIVLSEKAGEGRSTVAAALAVSAARSGRKTLLVDADFRNAHLTRTLTEHATSGLGQIATTDDCASLITPLGARLPDFCAAAPRDGESPLDIFGSRAMDKFREMARNNYELTVIDTPPMGKYADASGIVDLADSVVVVLQSGYSAKAEADELLKQLHLASPKPVGIVLNMLGADAGVSPSMFDPAAMHRDALGVFQGLKTRMSRLSRALARS